MKLQRYEQIHALFENALDAVIGMDDQGLIIDWNSQAEIIFGWKKSEAIGRRLSETIIPPEYREAHEQGLKRFQVTGEGSVLNHRLELTGLRRDGTLFPVELSVTPIRSGTSFISYAFLRDITEHKVHEDERNQHLAKMQEALRERDIFFSIASHELKTPLTALKLQIQMAHRKSKLGGSASPAQDPGDKTFESLERQVDNLGKLVDDLLDVARIHSGKLPFNFQEMNLSGLVAEVINRFSPQLVAAQCQVKLDLDWKVTGHWDQTRLEQVTTNLVSNVIKYAPYSTLGVSVKRGHGETVVLTVSDNGPGISKEVQEKIFDRFERGCSKASSTGLGLGLFIVKTIVTAHRGSVRLESEPGEGSSFIIMLPIYPAVSGVSDHVDENKSVASGLRLIGNQGQ